MFLVGVLSPALQLVLRHRLHVPLLVMKFAAAVFRLHLHGVLALVLFCGRLQEDEWGAIEEEWGATAFKKTSYNVVTIFRLTETLFHVAAMLLYVYFSKRGLKLEIFYWVFVFCCAMVMVNVISISAEVNKNVYELLQTVALVHYVAAYCSILWDYVQEKARGGNLHARTRHLIEGEHLSARKYASNLYADVIESAAVSEVKDEAAYQKQKADDVKKARTTTFRLNLTRDAKVDMTLGIVPPAGGVGQEQRMFKILQKKKR